jgi:hypothetical protein
MMKKIYAITLVLLFGISSYIFAAKIDITGKYAIDGLNPFGGTANGYSGKLEITALIPGTDVYQAFWNLNRGDNKGNIKGTLTGTGVRKGDFVSFVFSGSDGVSTLYGTQLYRIKRSQLVGLWILSGEVVAGSETAAKLP